MNSGDPVCNRENGSCSNPEVKMDIDIDKDFRKYIKTSSTNPIPADWFGNTPLHHAFAEDKVDIELVKNIIYNHPEYCRVKNQFGKLPIHYAVDRIRANAIWNAAGIRLLILAYPEGVNEVDSENQNVYDIAAKWEHSNALKLMILQTNPTIDMETYIKLKFWPFGHAYLAITQCLTKTRGACGCTCLHTNESDRSGMNGKPKTSVNKKPTEAKTTAPVSMAPSTSTTMAIINLNRVVPFHDNDDGMDENIDK